MKKRTYVHPYGNKETAKLIIIGDQPDKADLQTGIPFSGMIGRDLDTCLQDAKITRGECYFTNVIKDCDLPIERYISFTKKGPVISETANEYIKELAEELRGINAEVIIALGPEALLACCDRLGIQKWRGSILKSTLCDKTVIPTYHPNTFGYTKGAQFLNKHCIVFDIKRAKELASGDYVPTKRTLLTKPTYNEVFSFIDSCEENALTFGKHVAYDIEISNMEVSCISFSQNLTSMCIPFIDAGGDYFSPEQEANIWLRITQLLENPNIKKIGQNLVFDSHFLLRKFGIHACNLHDTMIAQRILMPDYKVGLDFITSIWTDLPYYKEDGKFWLKGEGSYERGWEYNAMDSVVCDEAFPKQVEALHTQGNWETYERTRQIILPLVFMMERGIRINVAQMAEDYEKTQVEIARLELELNDMAGQALNAKSPTQLCNYFYECKGIKPYKHQGRITTNELALKRISRLGYKEAAQILKIRGEVKENSTYRDTSKIDLDGRLRCSYNPVGTRYSRISSSANIFGTGNNLQNQPHGILKYFLADKGYMIYEIDLSQAENRIVAYVGRIEPMIEAFETNKDVHSLTGALISGKTPDIVKWEDDNNIPCPLGSGNKTWRFWGKKCVVGETEVLTPYGWVRIDKLDYHQVPIAQWSHDGRISFTLVSDFNIYVADKTIKLSGRNSCVEGTEEHRVPIHRSDKNLKRETTLGKLKLDSHFGIPTCGYLSNEKTVLNHFEVMLLVAFQADGSFNSNGHKFRFKKERKVKRLTSILNTLNIKHTVTITADGMTNIYFSGPGWLTKQFDSFLLLLGKYEMQTFMSELTYWDGFETVNRKQYFSTNRKNAEWVQTIAHLTGYTATIRESAPTGFGKKNLFHVLFNNRNKLANLSTHTKTVNNGRKLVYGPTVPTGFFLIKHEGRISVTGNSNHGLNYDLGYRQFSLYYEIPESAGKLIVERYHTAYPGVRKNFHSYVKACLTANRTLTNLMGRKTMFMGNLANQYERDKIFKEAYSCIPQGTVGDVINERGMNYVYYEDGFEELELLMQVHDSIKFQIPISIGWRRHAEMLIRIKRSLETPLVTHYGREFSIPADLSIGLNMDKSNMKQLKGSNFSENSAVLASKLSDIYEQLRPMQSMKEMWT